MTTSGHFDVIVIGGGASGMMAAGRAGERGRQVLLLEKNRKLGEKLKITGGGRCNITNAEENARLMLANYGTTEKFLYSPFSQFGVKDTFTFFESRGLPLVVQAGKRAFPKTEKAMDVFRVMESYVQRGQVEVRTEAEVSAVVAKDQHIQHVIVDGEKLTASSYIIATGGKSHPETGSTGDAFGWLKQLGHQVQDPTPTIVPLAVHDAWVKQLAGITMEKVKVIFCVDGAKCLVVTGRVLCTHFGLSGPLILNAAGKVADMLHEGEVTATIDTAPEMDLGTFDKHVTKIFDENKNRALSNVAKVIMPTGSARAILPLLLNIDPQKKVHSVTKAERRHIAQVLKALPVSIAGLMGFDRAVVADGGVSTQEIDSKTMQSRLYNNLFVTGDVLNISRPSGGYSLQLCWTTGYVAGSAV